MELDAAGWCPLCRRDVVRRATLIARVIAGLGAVAVGLWVVMIIRPGPRFLLLWLLLIGATYFFLFTLTRRVSFEVIRSRGVPPPEEED